MLFFKLEKNHKQCEHKNQDESISNKVLNFITRFDGGCNVRCRFEPRFVGDIFEST